MLIGFSSKCKSDLLTELKCFPACHYRNAFFNKALTHLAESLKLILLKLSKLIESLNDQEKKSTIYIHQNPTTQSKYVMYVKCFTAISTWLTYLIVYFKRQLFLKRERKIDR